jgi:hypothetical protein
VSLRLSPLNAMVKGSSEAKAPPADMTVLEGLGYSVVPIAELTIINTNPFARHPDPPLRWLADSGRFDALISGPDTQLVAGKYPRPPNGPVYRNGALDTEGNGRAHFRGTVVVLKDGTIVMGRADGAAAKELKGHFEKGKNSLFSALGGGALLIENGHKVGHLDLLQTQLYDGSPGGYRGRSMAAGVHTFMGIRKGQAYAGWCNHRTAMEIRGDFHQFGFTTLVKFAHGSSVFYDDCIDRLNGQNGTGFGITRAY